MLVFLLCFDRIALADSGIGLLQRCLQALRDSVIMILIIGRLHGLHGQFAGDLAVVVTAHAVRDDEECALDLAQSRILRHHGDEVIFIAWSRTSDVGLLGEGQREWCGHEQIILSCE